MSVVVKYKKPSLLSVKDVRKKIKGFHLRWVTPANVDRRKEEGYEVVTTKEVEQDSGDSKTEGSVVRKHDLILMKVPKDIARQRQAYYEDVARRRVLNTAKKQKEEAEKHIPKSDLQYLEEHGISLDKEE